MAPAQKPAARLILDAHCFRLSAKGRAFVHVVENKKQTVGSLSRHMYDVLMLCGTGAWFDQLRQFMPQHSLEDSLQALLSLELIEVVQPPEAPPRPSDQRRRTGSMLSQVVEMAAPRRAWFLPRRRSESRS